MKVGDTVVTRVQLNTYSNRYQYPNGCKVFITIPMGERGTVVEIGETIVVEFTAEGMAGKVHVERHEYTKEQLTVVKD